MYVLIYKMSSMFNILFIVRLYSTKHLRGYVNHAVTPTATLYYMYFLKADGQRFRAHKNILAATIPYFQGMFLSDFQENNMGIVPMNDITASNMDSLITFAYTGQITITDDNVESLIKDVDYLQLIDIKEECENFLLSVLRIENLCKTYYLADALNCSSLKEESYKLMYLNIHKLVQTEDFLDFEFSLLTDLVIANDLRHNIFSPSELFEIIMKWLINNFNDRKIHLLQLTRCVKFSATAFTDIHNYICKDEVVDKLSEYELRDLVADIISSHQMSEKPGLKNDGVDSRCFNQTKGRIVVVKNYHARSIQIYDPYTAEWESISINNSSNTYWGTVHGGRLYLFNLHLNVARFYEFENKRWEEIPLADFESRNGFIAGLDGYLYLCEGRIDNRFTGKIARFCLRTQHWENLSSMNVVRFDAAIIPFRRHIYAIGGIDAYTFSNAVERYDPETDKWTIISEMQNCRDGAAAAILNERIYVCGGSSGESDLDSVEFYDPEINRWENAAPMNVARQSFLVVALSGKLWALGGISCEKGQVLPIEVYDPVKNLWSIICSSETNLGRVFGGTLFA